MRPLYAARDAIINLNRIHNPLTEIHCFLMVMLPQWMCRSGDYRRQFYRHVIGKIIGRRRTLDYRRWGR